MKKEKTKSKIDKLLEKLDIDDTLTKPIYYKFPKVKNHIIPLAAHNYQSDLIELPKTKLGYRYLLVMVDLWSNYFDIEPMKNKQADTTLDAFKTIFFKRDILPLPEASIRTDGGSEFKNVVSKYLHDKNIFHSVTLPDRHKQLANMNSLCAQLTKLLMTYLTYKSYKLKTDYTEWTDIIDYVRKELNEIRNHPDDKDPADKIPPLPSTNLPKFAIGDLVYRRFEKPVDKYGNQLHDKRFRAGDNRFDTTTARKIVNILPYEKSWRYILNNLYNVSYDEAELLKANEKEETFVILKIIGKKIFKKDIYYLVWWKHEKKSDASWELKKNLIEDGAKSYVDAYEEDHAN
jgi:hypothetical protein